MYELVSSGQDYDVTIHSNNEWGGGEGEGEHAVNDSSTPQKANLCETVRPNTGM